MRASTSPCPCLSGLAYGECCQPLHTGEQEAPTAERLMRSRYSAFAVGDPAYLLRTWAPETGPASLDLDPEVRWFRLDIERTVGGGPFDAAGVVEFTAHYRSPDGAGTQHEVSAFSRRGGRWLYVGEA